jgi:hypothetical protein
MKNVTLFISRINSLLIELRDINRGCRGKIDEPSKKTENIEEKRGKRQKN